MPARAGPPGSPPRCAHSGTAGRADKTHFIGQAPGGPVARGTGQPGLAALTLRSQAQAQPQPKPRCRGNHGAGGGGAGRCRPGSGATRRASPSAPCRRKPSPACRTGAPGTGSSNGGSGEAGCERGASPGVAAGTGKGGRRRGPGSSRPPQGSRAQLAVGPCSTPTHHPFNWKSPPCFSGT